MHQPEKFPDDSLDVLDSLYTDIQGEPAARDIIDYARAQMSNGLLDYDAAENLARKLDELWKVQQLQGAKVVVTGRSRGLEYPSEWGFAVDEEVFSYGFTVIASDGDLNPETISAESQLFTPALFLIQNPTDKESAFVMDINHVVKYEYSDGKMSARKAEAILHTFAPEMLLEFEKVVHLSQTSNADAIKQILSQPWEFGVNGCETEDLVTAAETYLTANITIDREAHYVISASDTTGFLSSIQGGPLRSASTRVNLCDLRDVKNEWVVIDRVVYIQDPSVLEACETFRFPWLVTKIITPEHNGSIVAMVLPGASITKLQMARQLFGRESEIFIEDHAPEKD